MSSPNEVVVAVTMADGVVNCDKKWVNLFWRENQTTGRPARTTIRWTFVDIPAAVAWPGIEFLTEVPSKCSSVPGFLPDPVFNGIRFEPPSNGSHLPDMVTIGQKKHEGWFCYNIMLYDGGGNLVAQADPGGTNDPTEPPGDHG